MVVGKEAPYMFFDVDDTLVKPIEGPSSPMMGPFIQIRNQYFLINVRVIADLRLCKVRGHQAVVWSQGGATWAATVVRELGLEPYVDFVIAKPSWFIDDRKAEDILDKSRWYDGSF